MSKGISRKAVPPVPYVPPPSPPKTFAQKHNVLVVSVHRDCANDTQTARFSNEHCADAHVAWMTKQGYFSRIV